MCMRVHCPHSDTEVFFQGNFVSCPAPRNQQWRAVSSDLQHLKGQSRGEIKSCLSDIQKFDIYRFCFLAPGSF